MSLSLDFNLIMSVEKLCIYPQNTSLSLYRLYRTLIADSNHLINPEAQMDIYCAAAYNSNYFSINFFSWNKDVDLGSGYTRTSVKIVVSTQLVSQKSDQLCQSRFLCEFILTAVIVKY